MKTIKELADSLKVSKVSVYNAIKKDSIKKHTFKRDNVTLVDETGENLLIALFNKDISDNDLTDSKDDNKDFNHNESVGLLRELLKEKDAQINLLLGQLSEKDNQIKTKDNQIDTLQRLLENQQKLQIPLITDGKTKVSLWDRLFKKRGNQDE